MSYRTNPDRILENIDRARSRDMERALSLNDRQARGREMDTTVPESDATTPERMRRLFELVDSGYRARHLHDRSPGPTQRTRAL